MNMDYLDIMMQEQRQLTSEYMNTQTGVVMSEEWHDRMEALIGELIDLANINMKHVEQAHTDEEEE
mgnify:CR=1 FL=1|tara:strand:- start:2315 stop:2512 length:198 start_codon:yes stop_codon:yes gene_type:complete